jgi:RNA polymerase sigma factor (sigma-70 family)
MAMIGPEFPAVLGAAARGDEDTFGELWHDLQPRLLRYFRVVSPATAEDLASETRLGVVRGLDRFEGNEPAFRAWVFTIARHEVLDWRRRAARRPIEDLPATALVERAASEELAGHGAALAELRAVARARPAAAMAPGPASPRQRRRRTGLAVVVVVARWSRAERPGAATGHLPGPVRDAARDILGTGGGQAPSPSQNR